MHNTLALLVFWLLVVGLFAALVTRLGWPWALLISLSICLLIPNGILELLIGFIGLSLNMTLLAYALKYWPVTLLLSLIACMGHTSAPKQN